MIHAGRQFFGRELSPPSLFDLSWNFSAIPSPHLPQKFKDIPHSKSAIANRVLARERIYDSNVWEALETD